MEAPTKSRNEMVHRWLPYWAVLQADFRQTLHSWVYRTWVVVSIIAAVGHMVYHLGLHHEAGLIQHAATWMSGLLRYTVLGSVTLIIVLAGSCISSERGTLADSVLSRGISRYQYFLGKWHARLAAVLGTFIIMGVTTLVSSFCFLHEDLTVGGSSVALLGMCALLAVIVTCSVSVSATANSTIMSITILWLVLYGLGFGMSLLPQPFPSPERALSSLPFVLRGHYDVNDLSRLLIATLVVCCASATAGAFYFARRDV